MFLWEKVTGGNSAENPVQPNIGSSGLING